MAITDAKPGDESRSPEWPRVEKEHIAQHPTCEVCGGRDHLQVHHIKPFHLHPELELDPANLITLCEHPETNDHYVTGHLRDWKAYNPNVEQDAAAYLAELQARPYE